MLHTDDTEELLYSIIQELSKEEVPIIFKGGLALKSLLFEVNSELDTDRKTVDIDGNWIDEYDANKIQKTIEKAIKKIDTNYTTEIIRTYGVNRSMGINIMDGEQTIITKIDLDIKNNPFYVICTIDDVEIKYSSIEKIFADKLSSLSSEHIFRRVKDILDIYLIIQSHGINTKKINEILEYDNRTLGDFQTMLTNKELIRNSYNKLKGITNRPDFDIV